MRTITKILVAGMLCVFVAGQDLAQAQPPELSDSPSVSFRAAATTAVPGFKMMSSPEGRFYVGPDVLFTGNAVNAARLLTSGARFETSGLAMEVAVKPALSREIRAMMQGTAVDRLAIILSGSLIGAPVIEKATEDGRVFLAGLSHELAMHLMNLIGHTDTGSGPTLVSLVPDRRTVRPGEVFTVDLFIADVAGLRGYQMQVVATGPRTGPLPMADIRIDTQRPDYVFGTAQVINAADASHNRIASALFNGTVDVGGRMYLGTYSFQAPADAADMYYVNVVPGKESFLRTDDGRDIPFRIADGVLITSGPPTREPGAKPSRSD